MKRQLGVAALVVVTLRGAVSLGLGTQRALRAASTLRSRDLLPVQAPLESTLLCQYTNHWGKQVRIFADPVFRSQNSSGDALHTVSWQDERSIVIAGYKTNWHLCSVSLNDHSPEGACTSGTAVSQESNPPIGCHACPCSPVFNLEHPKDVAPVAMDICRIVAREYSCSLGRAVLVGFGISTVSQCFNHFCPGMQLTTVDIDPGAMDVGSRFFGWQHQSSVVVQDAGVFFRNAEANHQIFDLVVIDCFERDSIPAACNNAQFYASIKGVLSPTGGLFAMNTLYPTPWEDNIKRDVGGPRTTVKPLVGSWYMLAN